MKKLLIFDAYGTLLSTGRGHRLYRRLARG